MFSTVLRRFLIANLIAGLVLPTSAASEAPAGFARRPVAPTIARFSVEAVTPFLLDFLGFGNGRTKSLAVASVTPRRAGVLKCTSSVLPGGIILKAVLVGHVASGHLLRASESLVQAPPAGEALIGGWGPFLVMTLALAGPVIAMAFQSDKDDEDDLSTRAADRALAARLRAIANERSPRQRLAATLQRVVLDFAEKLEKGRPLTVAQREYARALVETYDSTVDPTYDPTAHERVVAAMAALPHDALAFLSNEERAAFVDIYESGAGDQRRQLTAPQVAYAESLVQSALERQRLNAFLDVLFAEGLQSTEGRMEELIEIFDRLIRGRWAGPREGARFTALLVLLVSGQPEASQALRTYASDRSPLRQDVFYGNTWRERYLVRLLVRVARHDGETRRLLEDALLHRNGLRLITRSAVKSVVQAFYSGRRNSIEPAVRKALSDFWGMRRRYDWWTPLRITAAPPAKAEPVVTIEPVVTADVAPPETWRRSDITARRQAIVDVIRAAWQADELPSMEWAAREHADLLRWATDPRVFDGWLRAARVAGVPQDLLWLLSPPPQKLLSKEATLEYARALRPEQRTVRFLATTGLTWTRSAERHLGSVNAALAAVGHPPIRVSDVTLAPAPKALWVDADLLFHWAHLRDQIASLATSVETHPLNAVVLVLDVRYRWRRLLKQLKELRKPEGQEPLVSGREIELIGAQLHERLEAGIREQLRRIVSERSRGFHVVLDRNYALVRRELALGYSVQGLLTDQDEALIVRLTDEVAEDLREGRAAGWILGAPGPTTATTPFRTRLFPALPWPETQESIDGRTWTVKRAILNGAQVVFRHDGGRRWAVEAGPSSFWRSVSSGDRGYQDDRLSLAWDGEQRRFTYAVKGAVRGGSKRRDVPPISFKLNKEPGLWVSLSIDDSWRIQFFTDLPPLAVDDHRTLYVGGRTGFGDVRRLHWSVASNVPRVDELEVSELFMHPALMFLDEVGKRTRMNMRSVRNEISEKIRQTPDGRIRYADLIDAVKSHGRMETPAILKAMNVWLERDHGYRIVVRKSVAGNQLALEPVDGDLNALKERVRSSRIDFRPPPATPAPSPTVLKLIPMFFASSLTFSLLVAGVRTILLFVLLASLPWTGFGDPKLPNRAFRRTAAAA